MDDQTVNTLLADNNISLKEFKDHPERITFLECFHFNIPAHPSFEKFKFLTELRLMEQDTVDLEWLSGCPKLTKLTVFHTLLSNTSGLKYAPNITSLHLDGNKITEFPDITCLHHLEEFSLSDNPLKKSPVYPVMESLKNFNITNSKLTSIDPSIKNFSNLEILNVSGNLIPDFKFVDSIKPLKKLKELYVSDPRFASNPISLEPNYETIVINALPQITILDTFVIPEKFRQIAENRIKEVNLYYQSCISSEITALQIANSGFQKEVENDLSSIKPNKEVNLVDIYSIVDTFNYSQKCIENLIRKSYQCSFESGGNISFIRIDENSSDWNILIQNTSRKVDISSSAQLVAAWKIQSRVASDILNNKKNNNILLERYGSVTKAEMVQTFLFLPLKELDEAVTLVEQWCYNEKRADEDQIQQKVQISDDIASFIICDKYKKDMYLPNYLLFFSVLNEASLSQIDSICEKANEIQVSPTSTDEILVAFNQTTYDLKNTLTSVTLINCGITNLSIFSELEHCKSISIPHNQVKTLKNMPHLPMLASLDVNFNRIEKVSDLIPDEHAVTALLEKLTIFGNPVCTPQVLRLISQLFPQVENPLTKSYSNTKNHFLMNLDDLSNDLNLSVKLECLTVLDISDNGLFTSLSPLSNLPQLEKLFASNNSIEKVDFKSNSLIYADFSNNLITEFPSQSQFPKLETLMINYNHITSLPKGEFLTLISLYVAGNGITSIPYSTQFPSLVVLFISENPLLNSPTDLRVLYQFPKLKMLNGLLTKSQTHSKAKASFNGILFPEDLPLILSPDQNQLDLSEKEYSDINSLESKNLQKLVLNHNLLKSITWKPNSLPRLAELYLSSNELQSFDFLSLIPTVKILDLSFNKLNDDAFKSIVSFKLPRLTVLNVSNNSFRNVPIVSQSFPSLEKLDASHNYILSISPGSFEGMKTVDLSYNSLQKLDNVGASSILQLDVSHNRITTVDEVYKLSVKCLAIERFAFHDNPLGQRVSPRIRCLAYLRTLKEMDGRPVTEADLSQVKILIDQGTNSTAGSGGGGPGAVVGPPGRQTRVNNVNLGFGLPALQNPQQGRKPRKK
ncbi:hypothetical protein M9Y10_009585 [Tritrichomonas musculus]|uniref:Leucine Rich Repeat family protein n=1 Tax=Tritrichomonas musculus TaxID=1915356 RepID=A0ABR2IQ51_9EUKA